MAQTLDHQPSSQSNPARISPWRDIFYYFALVATFIAGGFVSGMYRGGPMVHDFALVFVALGALSLGFGAGILLYRRQRQRDTDSLRVAYNDLGQRARVLVSELQRMNRKQPPDG